MTVFLKTINLVVLFGSYGFFIFSITSIDNQLKKTYREFGFSRTEAKFFCAELNALCKQHLGVKRVRSHGVSAEALGLIMTAGLLIELSDHGYHRIDNDAKEFVGNANNRTFPLSDKAARLLRVDAKKFVFSWIISCLQRYEKVSFYSAYVMQYDVSRGALLDLTYYFAHETSDFNAKVISLDELADEFGLLGIG